MSGNSSRGCSGPILRQGEGYDDHSRRDDGRSGRRAGNFRRGQRNAGRNFCAQRSAERGGRRFPVFSDGRSAFPASRQGGEGMRLRFRASVRLYGAGDGGRAGAVHQGHALYGEARGDPRGARISERSENFAERYFGNLQHCLGRPRRQRKEHGGGTARRGLPYSASRHGGDVSGLRARALRRGIDPGTAARSAKC